MILPKSTVPPLSKGEVGKTVTANAEVLSVPSVMATVAKIVSLLTNDLRDISVAIVENSTRNNDGSNARRIYNLVSACLGLGGREGRVTELVKQMELENNRGPNYWLALVYARVGKTAEALTQLEKLYQARGVRMVHLKTDPRLDSLRADPRFHELLRKMNLN